MKEKTHYYQEKHIVHCSYSLLEIFPIFPTNRSINQTIPHSRSNDNLEIKMRYILA